MGLDNAWGNFLAWIKNFVEGLILIVLPSDYPEWLVLEVGVDRPGDMAAMVKWLPLDIVVVTALPEVPVHVEYFSSPEEVVKEKWLLPSALSQTGLAILNTDDPKIRERADSLKCRVMTYGFAAGADLRGSQPHVTYNNEKKTHPSGLGVRVDHQQASVPFHLVGVLGEHQLYALLAAAAVGVALDINLIDSRAALEKLVPTPGRMRLLPGIKDTIIIDDTYNASPAALEAALNTLSELRLAGRKIAVLGDMLELGSHAVVEHKKVGIHAARVAHLLLTVGLRMKFATEEASRKKMGKRVLHHFDDSRSAGAWLQNELEPGDIVLVKGSQSMRMERVVEEIMAQPELKNKLLVRQEEEWQKR
jgi:UDP-N-acetylmuramoyl-tripeptide--D-alanyl-D-alanine ligase